MEKARLIIKLIILIITIIISTENIKAQDRGLYKKWIELLKVEQCFMGQQDYIGEKDETNPEVVPSIESGAFASKEWYDFLRNDKKEVVPFLIKQISDFRKTQLHVCPNDNALRGELAIYCLQHILKKNWYDLDAEYKKIVNPTQSKRSTYYSEQREIQKIIKSKIRVKKMINLWNFTYQLSLASDISSNP